MKNGYEGKMNESWTKEISEFHNLFRPYVNRIYRGALILTNNPKIAETLQTEIYLEAFMQYLHDNDGIDFKIWLLQIIDDCFSTRKRQNSEMLIKKESLQKQAIELIAAIY